MGKYKLPMKVRGHGASGYWIIGEGYYGPNGDNPKLEEEFGSASFSAQSSRSQSSDSPEPGEPGMRFCRLFNLDKFTPDQAALEELGATMANADQIDEATDSPPDSTIPAGFTYFGQFVDHDITRTVGAAELGTGNSTQISNFRTPSLDLDSVYGAGPQNETFYESDGLHLKVGVADAIDFGSAPELPNDLPRKPVDNQIPERADIGDDRNDENLAVAQTHLAFLKFHNKVADTEQGIESLEQVQKVVRQHYQSIVYHDYVPRLVDMTVYDRVNERGRQWFLPTSGYKNEEICMPIEFSVAAFRLGHTMVRNRYQWNRVFRSGGTPDRTATLVNLFQFSEVSGNFTSASPSGDGAPRLPANWVANWLLLFDFSENPGVESDPHMNLARPLNTVLAEKLAELEEFRSIPETALRHLAIRNLLRGSQVGLPSGQAVARAMGVEPLTGEQVAKGPHGEVIRRLGFDTQTPLWYYILKEAEELHSGQHLGEVGSTIVVETFHGLLENSVDTFMKEKDWSPSLPSADPTKFTMADMLVYVDDLNPLAVPA